MRPADHDHQDTRGQGERSRALPADLVRPHPSRLDPASAHYEEICECHEAAILAGEPLYLDPFTGLWVMTAATLWERECCDNGCRHCPHPTRDR
ncbi:MAG: DUF5522 domain-containing protein [Planctomycetota bacterium]